MKRDCKSYRGARPLVLMIASLAAVASTAYAVEAVADLGPKRLGIGAREARPAGFVLDGDASEWGELGAPAAPMASAMERDGKTLEPEASAEVDPGSQLVFVLSPDGVTLAGRLGASAARGFWLGLGSPVPPTLATSRSRREEGPYGTEGDGGDVEHFGLPCGEYDWRHEALTRAQQRQCEAAARQHRAFAEDLAVRFSRRLWVDAGGVSTLGANGRLSPTTGASVAFQPSSAGGATVELTLPPSALPTMSEAPVYSVKLLALGGDRQHPPDAAGWPEVALPASVGFEPMAALRAFVFREAGQRGAFLSGLFYEATAPGFIEDTVNVDEGLRLTTVRSALYTKEMVLGDYEIGRLGPRFAPRVLRRGEAIVGTFWPEGTPMGVVERGKDTHVFVWMTKTLPTVTYAMWRVAVLRPSAGSPARPLYLTQWMSPHFSPVEWGSVSMFHDASFETFGARGLGLSSLVGEPQDFRPLELTWRWEPMTELYEATTTWESVRP